MVVIASLEQPASTDLRAASAVACMQASWKDRVSRQGRWHAAAHLRMAAGFSAGGSSRPL